MLNPQDLLLGGHILSGVTLLGGAVVLVANLASMPKLRAVQWSKEEAPKVSVLIPARNEAENIERCVRSLMAQDYPNYEIRVLDDHSTDETAELVRALGLNESAGTLLRGRDLPAGWVGKNWACHQLSKAASGEYLFFTDADTVHAPGVIGGLVAAAREHRADLVSAWPRQEVVTWSEKLVVSLLPFGGALFYPHAFLRVLGEWPHLRNFLPMALRRVLGGANGQALFFSRKGYEAIGGHEAVSGHLVEDVALGRAVAERMGEGGWWVNVDSAGLIRCRMYRSFAGVWEGFSKNARAVFEDQVLGFVLLGVWQVVFLMLPFVWAVWPGPYRWWALGEVGVILSMRAMVTVRCGGSWWSVCLHPFAYLLGMAIGVNSWRRSAGPGVFWKGRLYSMENSKPKPGAMG